MTRAARNLNDGPVARVSAPMSLGIFSVLAIGLADAFFLARVGGAALAAVGFVYPVIVAVSAFSVGMSAGANAALSQARGSDDGEDAVSRLALHACTLGLAVGLAFAGLLWNTQFYHYDALGSTANLSNEAANIQISYRYDAFGGPREVDSSGSILSTSYCI